MKSKLIIFLILLSITLTVYNGQNNNTRQNPNGINKVPNSTVPEFEQTTKPTDSDRIATEPVVTCPLNNTESTTSYDYFIYNGDWICEDKKTSLYLNIDLSGNVEGSITTVVGSHVPSSLISGVIWNDVLISKLDDGNGCIGTLVLSFTDDQKIEGNLKLDKSSASYWNLAEGDMSFRKY